MIELTLSDRPANITDKPKPVHIAGALTVPPSGWGLRVLWFRRWRPSRW